MEHLKEFAFDANRITLSGLKRTFEAQAKTRIENGNDTILEPCWECRDIAVKLGFGI